MPKTERKYTKNINVRISLQQYKKWENYANEKGFGEISKLVRYATDGLIEGSIKIQGANKRNKEIEKRIHTLENNNKELLKAQREILQLIAKKTPEPKDVNRREYQTKLVFNLLEINPMSAEDLSKTLDVSEAEVLSIINEFLELGVIYNDDKDKTKYMVSNNG